MGMNGVQSESELREMMCSGYKRDREVKVQIQQLPFTRCAAQRAPTAQTPGVAVSGMTRPWWVAGRPLAASSAVRQPPCSSLRQSRAPLLDSIHATHGQDTSL